jgi:predicted ATPase
VLGSDSVRATLLGRIRLLDRTERAVLMRAAVIGRRFAVAVLTAATTCGEARVRAALRRACALQLVVLDEAEGDVYAFRHALIRDAAYGELVGARLRPIHRRIARALEDATGTVDIALDDLAYHSWAGGDVRRCLRYNELAGDRAAAVFATEDACRYYARARALIPIDSSAYARVTTKLAIVEAGAGSENRPD